MGVNWKLSAIVAAICLVLSLFIGILARNDFWTVVLRAVLLAVVGGALAIGLRWAAYRFLPELSQAPGNEESHSEGMGRAVDIVVADAEGAQGLGPMDAGTGPAAAKRHPDAVTSPAADQGDDDFAQEVEELRSQEIIPGQGDLEASTYEPVRAPTILEDVDVLPDLDGFQDSFGSATPADQAAFGSAPEAESPSFSRKAPKGGSLSADDPSTLAQAIRTVLSKEKKG